MGKLGKFKVLDFQTFFSSFFNFSFQINPQYFFPAISIFVLFVRKMFWFSRMKSLQFHNFQSCKKFQKSSEYGKNSLGLCWNIKKKQSKNSIKKILMEKIEKKHRRNHNPYHFWNWIYYEIFTIENNEKKPKKLQIKIKC